MALDQSVLSELLAAFQSGEGLDLIRESVRLVCQELIETELSALIGAGRYERSEDRTNERNGHRSRVLTTKAGDVDLAIPKLRRGSFFPSILEPRRRIDQALYAVVMEAYVHGVSTRAVDELVEAMGSSAGISKSEVSRICAGLEEAVGAFRGRRLDHARFAYIFLDATYLHVRSEHQVTSKAVVIATGVSEDGRREILGIEIGDSEDEAFWREFLRSLKRRGLAGVQLVISDQHAGLVAAIGRCFQGAAHQRCRVHFARINRPSPMESSAHPAEPFRLRRPRCPPRRSPPSGTTSKPCWPSASTRPPHSCAGPKRRCSPLAPSPGRTGAGVARNSFGRCPHRCPRGSSPARRAGASVGAASRGFLVLEPQLLSPWTLTWTFLWTSPVHHAAMHTTDATDPRSISDQLGDDRLVLSGAEAGALLGLSGAFAYELVARGELPVVRFGRRIVVPKAALLELLSSAPSGR